MPLYTKQPTGAHLFSTPIDEPMRHKLEQMFREGATEAQIRAVCPSYQGFVPHKVAQIGQEDQSLAAMQAYMDKHPLTWIETVEGTIEEADHG